MSLSEYENTDIFFGFFELTLHFVGLMGQTQQHLPTVARLRMLWDDWDAAPTLGDQFRMQGLEVFERVDLAGMPAGS